MGYKMSDAEILQRISNTIREEVECCTKPKSQIAKEIGVTTGALSQYFSGAAYPNLITLKKLCQSLGCSADTILGIKLP